MEIFERETIVKYSKKHAIVKKTLDLWYNDVKSKKWKSPNDIKRDFITASIINKNRVVFNIKGNSYRLVAEINFEKQWLIIKFIGTHAEYDKIDAATVDKY
ncbi:MAG: type II toxin-antitoxin system HigB family toxin [Bacteroidia bacterium]|jgi:mRNA interferase HigB|nr:type II toxin-antitoxin system HigB family toxin [Bacteroidia bacterium]